MRLRDASNVLRSVAAIHMRDASNVLRTVPAVHMRDSANALKSAYAAGGGGLPPVTIAPASSTTTSRSSFANTSAFVATFNAGTPTSIVWSVEDVENGTASVVTGQGTNTANVQLTANDIGGDSVTAFCTIRCTAIIGGTTYSGTATKQHSFIYRDPGGGGGGLGSP